MAEPINDGYTTPATIKGVDGKVYQIEFRPMLGAKRARLFGGTIQLSRMGWAGMQAAADATVSAICDFLVSLSIDGLPQKIDTATVGALEPDVFEAIERYITRESIPEKQEEPSQEEKDAKN